MRRNKIGNKKGNEMKKSQKARGKASKMERGAGLDSGKGFGGWFSWKSLFGIGCNENQSGIIPACNPRGNNDKKTSNVNDKIRAVGDNKKPRRWEGMFLAAVLFIITFTLIYAHAQPSEDEASVLEQELSTAGYNWLINYTLADDELLHSQIKVYEYNQSKVIATFDNISQEGWYRILLTNLGGCNNKQEANKARSEENKVLTDYGNCSDSDFINVSSNESCPVSNGATLSDNTTGATDNMNKEKEAFDVASTAMLLVQDDTNKNASTYINFSDNQSLDNTTGATDNSSALDNSSSDSCNSYSQNIFDLYMNGKAIDFDYIVDPELNASYESGLVALYHFDNSTGENATYVRDWANGINNGTVVGGAVWNSTGGILGTGAFQLGGSLGYIGVKYKTCPQNMSYIDKLGGYCIDQYEASMPSANSTDMGNSSDTAARDAPGSRAAISQPGVVPWVEISANSARIACTNAGKHLCTDSEWLGAANIWGKVYNLPSDLASSPYYCVTGSGTYCLSSSWNGTGTGVNGNACNTGKNKTGGISKCVSAEGVYDMIGNVNEWTNNTVNVTNPLGNSTVGTGTANWYYYNGTGWATGTGTATVKYGNDGVYFPTTNTGRAVQRGGHWTRGASAGSFYANLNIGPPNAGGDIGFRCCQAPS